MRPALALISLLAPLVTGCERISLVIPITDGEDPSGTSGLPDDRPLVAARIATSGPRHCARPRDRERFGPFERREADGAPDSRAYLSGGVISDDLDGDGYLDLLTPLEAGARLFRGRRDARMSRWSDRLTSFDLSMGTGGSVADHDGDGDPDLLILRYDQPAVLLRNDGNGSFTDASSDLPRQITGPTTSSAWGDVDRDGDLDLFVGSYGYLEGDTERPAPSYLFENAGDGTFFDQSDTLPEELHRGYTRVGGFHDLDGDGYPELYVVNDIGSVSPNLLLRNDHGRLTLETEPTGLGLQMAGGGLGVGDVDNDDVPDFLIPQWDDLSLMLSGGDSRWFDAADARDLHPGPDQRVGWGAELADIDNDGDLDGVVAYGTMEVELEGWDNPERQPDALFLQQPDGTFADVARKWGVDDDGKNRGIVVADFDGDGWLDLAKRDLDGPSALYVSHCGAEHWLKVRLRDPAVPNSAAIGARVRVFGPDGSARSRWVVAGGTGYGTGGPPEVHVGLGDIGHIDHIEVRWPDGTVSSVGHGLEADQTVTVIRD